MEPRSDRIISRRAPQTDFSRLSPLMRLTYSLSSRVIYVAHSGLNI